MTPEQTLKHYFGYDSFRFNQEKIIQSVLIQKDTIVLLPTGGGKSLCYQIPGLICRGTTIVVSPLISLMQDQVQALHRRNIAATYINSSLSTSEITDRLATFSTHTFVYVAPERLKNPAFLKAVSTSIISLIAIDEAHCISQWGHDFRPAYRKIAHFIHTLPQKPSVIALTATATPRVVSDIKTSLYLKKPMIFASSFSRNNLTFNVRICQNRHQQELLLFRFLKKHQHLSGIIYVSTRKKAAYLSQLFVHFNFLNQQPEMYHGGLSSQQRSEIQERFISDQTNIIIATNAFGMGVDKPNVRFVLHYQVPANIENYYQEAGRAGRDGKSAQCLLLFHPHDLVVQQQMIIQSTHKSRKKFIFKKLKKMIGYTQTNSCRQKYITAYFGQSSAKCGRCDNCQQTIQSTTSQERANIHKLLIMRKKIAQKYHKHPVSVASLQLIEMIAFHQPVTKEDFLKIPGVGTGWAEQWYPQIKSHLPWSN